MSDMIDRLAEVANDAGSRASDGLRSDATARVLERRIREGVRRRRIRLGALTGAAVLVAGAVGIVVPRLMVEPPLAPAASPHVRTVILSAGGLTTYADGSMTVLTDRGEVVDVPAPSAGTLAFAPLSRADGCAAIVPGQFPPGWTFERREYTRLVSAGRAQVVDASGYHIVLQGQPLAMGPEGPPALAFSLDADPAVGDHLTMVLDSRFVAPSGETLYYQSQLESQPAIDMTGNASAGTATAVLQSRPLGTGTWCVESAAFPATVTRYLSARVYLHDDQGRSTLIATDNSWTTLSAGNS